MGGWREILVRVLAGRVEGDFGEGTSWEGGGRFW